MADDDKGVKIGKRLKAEIARLEAEIRGITRQKEQDDRLAATAKGPMLTQQNQAQASASGSRLAHLERKLESARRGRILVDSFDPADAMGAAGEIASWAAKRGLLDRM